LHEIQTKKLAKEQTDRNWGAW